MVVSGVDWRKKIGHMGRGWQMQVEEEMRKTKQSSLLALRAAPCKKVRSCVVSPVDPPCVSLTLANALMVLATALAHESNFL